MMVLVFILGLCFGSFASVLSARLPIGQNFVNSRSKCTVCGHVLSYKDLIPVMSFLMLKGKCRYCSARIAFRYIILEVFCGFAAVLSFYILGYGFLFILSLFFVSFLSASFVILAERKKMPLWFLLTQFGFLVLIIIGY